MKLFSPLKLIAFSLITSISINAQSSETCDTPKDMQINDLNSISKCTIKKEEGNSRKVTLNVASNNIRKRVVRKRVPQSRAKVNGLNDTKNLKKDVNSNTETLVINNKIINRDVTKQEILFSVVHDVPLFPKCENEKGDSVECFNNQFSKHFAKNFDPERASDNGVNGKVFLQFTITLKGEINNILIKSRNKNELLEKEIKRVVNKLPKLIPGKHNNLPVNVKYSLPINFSEN
ncbi:energy transducer TonB [uncultured Tenacibaculum sp.]|uniref:energy transducer TonB n=1 Tax=uncultured Tenacibaculum sp. TaxID=174713 RepID=UPI00261ACD00|nr:energy transducer TonB [uncultured Tenacibaculum sp.]